MFVPFNHSDPNPITSGHRHKLSKDSKCSRRYGFIFQRYRPECYWFEIVEMCRKLLLTGIILMAEPGSIFQLSLALLIGSYFMAIHIHFMPYKLWMEELLQTVSLVSTVLVLVTAIMLHAAEMSRHLHTSHHSRLDTPPGWLLVVINAATGTLAAVMATIRTRRWLTAQTNKMTQYAVIASAITTLCCIAVQKAKQRGTAPESSAASGGPHTEASNGEPACEHPVAQVGLKDQGDSDAVYKELDVEALKSGQPEVADNQIFEPGIQPFDFCLDARSSEHSSGPRHPTNTLGDGNFTLQLQSNRDNCGDWSRRTTGTFGC